MDIATIIGVIFGLAVIIWAIVMPGTGGGIFAGYPYASTT